MKRKPAGYRSKPTAVDDMSQLYKSLVCSLYERPDHRRAERVAGRLEASIQNLGRAPASIFLEECRSLVHEARGDLPAAIKHRLREIHLIRRLHRLAEKSGQREFILRQYTYEDLRDRLVILAMLYSNRGNQNRAIDTLEQCKQLCEQHAVEFDSSDLLKECQRNKRAVRDS